MLPSILYGRRMPVSSPKVPVHTQCAQGANQMQSVRYLPNRSSVRYPPTRLHLTLPPPLGPL
eukprot:1181892-Prorocentrum_minimum.AAC.1